MLLFFLQTKLFEGAVMEVDAMKEEAAKFANVLNKKYHKI